MLHWSLPQTVYWSDLKCMWSTISERQMIQGIWNEICLPDFLPFLFGTDSSKLDSSQDELVSRRWLRASICQHIVFTWHWKRQCSWVPRCLVFLPKSTSEKTALFFASRTWDMVLLSIWPTKLSWSDLALRVVLSIMTAPQIVFRPVSPSLSLSQQNACHSNPLNN